MEPGASDESKPDRYDGKPYGKDRLARLKRYLKRRKVVLQIGTSKGNGFSAEANRPTTMYLIKDPTRYMVWHELLHYVHLKRIGRAAYQALERPRSPEQFVFEGLRYGRRWELLNAKEKDHSLRYVADKGGDPDRREHGVKGQ